MGLGGQTGSDTLSFLLPVSMFRERPVRLASCWASFHRFIVSLAHWPSQGASGKQLMYLSRKRKETTDSGKVSGHLRLQAQDLSYFFLRREGLQIIQCCRYFFLLLPLEEAFARGEVALSLLAFCKSASLYFGAGGMERLHCSSITFPVDGALFSQHP